MGSTCGSVHPPSETPYATLGHAVWPAATASRLVAALLVADGMDPYQPTTSRHGTSRNMDAMRGFFDGTILSTSRGCSRPSAVSSSVCPIMVSVVAQLLCVDSRALFWTALFATKDRFIKRGTSMLKSGNAERLLIEW